MKAFYGLFATLFTVAISAVKHCKVDVLWVQDASDEFRNDFGLFQEAISTFIEETEYLDINLGIASFRMSPPVSEDGQEFYCYKLHKPMDTVKDYKFTDFKYKDVATPEVVRPLDIALSIFEHSSQKWMRDDAQKVLVLVTRSPINESVIVKKPKTSITETSGTLKFEISTAELRELRQRIITMNDMERDITVMPSFFMGPTETDEIPEMCYPVTKLTDSQIIGKFAEYDLVPSIIVPNKLENKKFYFEPISMGVPYKKLVMKMPREIRYRAAFNCPSSITLVPHVASRTVRHVNTFCLVHKPPKANLNRDLKEQSDEKLILPEANRAPIDIKGLKHHQIDEEEAVDNRDLKEKKEVTSPAPVEQNTETPTTTTAVPEETTTTTAVPVETTTTTAVPVETTTTTVSPSESEDQSTDAEADGDLKKEDSTATTTPTPTNDAQSDRQYYIYVTVASAVVAGLFATLIIIYYFVSKK